MENTGSVENIGSRLKDIKTRLDSGEASPTPTVREFLSWVNAHRRGVGIVTELRDHLRRAGLQTNPDFDAVPLESEIEFMPRQVKSRSKPSTGSANASSTGVTSQTEDTSSVESEGELRYQISRLESANTPPVYVSPNETLKSAMTKMHVNDYSQLPVMINERTVKGVVSWQSIARHGSIGAVGEQVKDFMDAPVLVDYHASLRVVMKEVAAHDYVLVRHPNNTIGGIVTTSDIHSQFEILTEPFLLLGEIEGALRRVLSQLPIEELRAAVDPSDPRRQVNRVTDLTFGEYIRILENPERWDKVKIPLDGPAFVNYLDQVRKIRNDVMHFDPDGIPPESVVRLRNLVHVLNFVRPKS